MLAQGATAGITNIQLIKNGALICNRSYSGMTTADTVSLVYTDTHVLAWTYYRAKVWQSPTPRVLADGDTNTPVTMTTACERAWSSPLWIEGERTSPLTVYVNAGATGRNTGITWTDAMTNLVHALDAARNGDEVWLAAGVYRPLRKQKPTAWKNLFCAQALDSARRFCRRRNSAWRAQAREERDRAERRYRRDRRFLG